MNTTTQLLVEGYLARLRVAAADLPSDRRADVLADIEEHIATAQANGMTEESQIRVVLDRLGEPADIVAAAAPEGSNTRGSGTGGGGAEIWAVVLFLVAEVLFFFVPLSLVAWVIALGCLIRSRRWTFAEKSLAGGILAPGFWLVLVSGTAAARTSGGEACAGPVRSARGRVEERAVQCTGDTGLTSLNYVVWALLIAFLIAQAIVAWRLVRSARRPA